MNLDARQFVFEAFEHTAHFAANEACKVGVNDDVFVTVNLNLQVDGPPIVGL